MLYFDCADNVTYGLWYSSIISTAVHGTAVSMTLLSSVKWRH
jgi:hypothetical protein